MQEVAACDAEGASLILESSGWAGGSGGGKRRREGEEGEEKRRSRATPHCSRLLLVTGIPPLAVFEKLVTRARRGGAEKAEKL